MAARLPLPGPSTDIHRASARTQEEFMSRFTAQLPALALSLIYVAAACGGSDKGKTTSTSAGSTPTVSAANTTENTEDVPASSPVSYRAAETAYSEKRYPEAVSLFTAYAGAEPENPWGHYMLGLSAWKAGEHEQAMKAFDQALQLDPSHRKSWFNSGRVMLETGRPKDALERIQKGLELEPMSSEGLRLLGRVRYELGEVEAAIQAYHRALSVDERDVWSMNNLGLIYIQTGRSSEAIPPLARAVEIRGNSPVFQNNLATALERSGYPTAAAKAYESAIAVDSTYTKASVGLARVTGGGQQPETTPIDLAALAQQFQAEITSWQVVQSDSAVASTDSVSDSVVVSSDSVSDSVLVSGGEVSDSLEECATEEDL
jgi:predicted Zn-dependent protease